MAALPQRLCFVAATTIGLSACAPTATSTPTASPSASAITVPSPTPTLVRAPRTLVNPGTLTVLSDTLNPPQESIDPSTNKPVGFDIDIATAIAARMGLSATVVSTDYALIIKSLLDHKGDAVISAMSITPELERSVAFVGYFESGQSMLVRKGNPSAIARVADLCGKRVGVQVTTSEQDTLTSENSGDCTQHHIDVRTFATDTAAVQSLREGGLDAVLDDAPVAASFVSGNPDSLEVAGMPLSLVPEGIAVDPKNTEVLSAIQQAMLAIYADGTYRAILSRWNLTGLEIPASEIVVQPSPSPSASG